MRKESNLRNMKSTDSIYIGSLYEAPLVVFGFTNRSRLLTRSIDLRAWGVEVLDVRDLVVS